MKRKSFLHSLIVRFSSGAKTAFIILLIERFSFETKTLNKNKNKNCNNKSTASAICIYDRGRKSYKVIVLVVRSCFFSNFSRFSSLNLKVWNIFFFSFILCKCDWYNRALEIKLWSTLLKNIHTSPSSPSLTYFQVQTIPVPYTQICLYSWLPIENLHCQLSKSINTVLIYKSG